MYLRGNSAHDIEGDRELLAVGLTLRGRAGAPARAAWRWRAPFRKLAIGLRVAANAKAAPLFDKAKSAFACELDGEPLAMRDATPEDPAASVDGGAARHWLAEIDLSAADPERDHWLAVAWASPAPLTILDVVVRPRGLGDDPIGDELTIEEGRYWSAWVGAHWDAGDRSIADGRVRGTHPSFLPIGVRDPDHRDRKRRYGFFPDRLTDFLFEPIAARRGGLGLELGTGCGQFALEASRHGLRMIGVDLGAGLLKIAREVAREREAAEPGLRMDYLRAESARLPLRSGVFDVVAAKDSLHHLIDVEAAFGEAKRVMKPGGAFVADEQVFAAPWIDRLFVTTTLLLRPLILRRHAVGPVPAVLTHPSPLEDRGCHAVLPAFRATFGRRSEAARWLFVDFVEMHAHYAFRKWRWLAGPPLIALAWAIEGTIRLAVGRPLGMGLRGENEP